MDLGDLIFPIIIIGSIIVQWLTSRRGEDNPQDDLPDASDPSFPEQGSERRRTSDQDSSWDDLMEALGQPTAPPEIPPVINQPVPVPEPIPTPVYQAPETPAYMSLIDRQKEELAEKKRQLEKIKAKSKVRLPAKDMTSQPRVPAETSLDLRNMLNNRRSLKKAIVLNEILQPPVSLR